MAEAISNEQKEVRKSAQYVDENCFGMDFAANAMLFAEELIDYVLKKLGYNWICVVGARKLPRDKIKKRFTDIVGDCVIKLIAANRDHIAESYNNYVQRNITNIDDYRRELCITATMYFGDGYSHKKFLTFAALVSGLSCFFFAKGNQKIADASAQFLAYLINYYTYQMMFSPKLDWFEMCLAAQDMKRMLIDGTVEFTLQPFNEPARSESVSLKDTASK